MRRTYDMTNQEMLHKDNCFRERTARRSGKLVKRIVAVASLALDGLDVLAHFFARQGRRGSPCRSRRARGHPSSGPSTRPYAACCSCGRVARCKRELSERGCKNRARFCQGVTQGSCARQDWRRRWGGVGLLLLAEVIG